MTEPITRLNAALEGRYTIERELGEGAMAVVYLARDATKLRNPIINGWVDETLGPVVR